MASGRGEAAGYAEAVGLLDEAVVANLEAGAASEEAGAAMKDAGLVITTGAVGYVSEETFGKIADAAGKPPWVAAFVLRQFPFDEIADRLAEFGLVTEKLPDATFLQRRFRDEAARVGTIEAVRAAGCLMQYVQDTQRTAVPHIRGLSTELHDEALVLDVPLPEPDEIEPEPDAEPESKPES